jgi:hypothetical protein
VSHWTDDLERDGGAGEPLVRPYTITGGRTAPGHDGLTLITLVTSAGHRPPGPALQPEHAAILEHCARPLALAEIAAALDLPVCVTKILVADLAGRHLVTVRAPLAAAHGRRFDSTLLQEVRNGLASL